MWCIPTPNHPTPNPLTQSIPTRSHPTPTYIPMHIAGELVPTPIIVDVIAIVPVVTTVTTNDYPNVTVTVTAAIDRREAAFINLNSVRHKRNF